MSSAEQEKMPDMPEIAGNVIESQNPANMEVEPAGGETQSSARDDLQYLNAVEQDRPDETALVGNYMSEDEDELVHLGEVDVEVVDQAENEEPPGVKIELPRCRSKVHSVTRSTGRESMASVSSTSTEGAVRYVMEELMDDIAGPRPDINSNDFSPAASGGEEVFADVMDGLDDVQSVQIKEEERESNSGRHSVSDESFQSTTYVGVTSTFGGPSTCRGSSEMDSDRLLRNLGLRTRGAENAREGSEEIEPPRNSNQSRQASRGRPKKAAVVVKAPPIVKKTAPSAGPNLRFSTNLKRVCVFTKCENYMKSPPGMMMTGFPDENKKPIIRRKWLDAVNGAPGVTKKLLLGNLSRSPHFGLCLKHFNRKTDFKTAKAGEKLVMFDWAVPTFKETSKDAAAATKSQFARKTVVPVTKLVGGSKFHKGLPSVEEEAISDGEEALDDSDRDADWEKTTDARKKKLRRNPNRRRNPNSTSEESEHETDDDGVPEPVMAPRNGQKLIAPSRPATIMPRLMVPSRKPGDTYVLMAPTSQRAPLATPVPVVSRGPGRPTRGLIPATGPGLGGVKQAPSRAQLQQAPSISLANKGSVRLVLQKITPLPPPPIVLPPKIIMKSPVRLALVHKEAQNRR